jgi:HEAT repeat protein
MNMTRLITVAGLAVWISAGISAAATPRFDYYTSFVDDPFAAVQTAEDQEYEEGREAIDDERWQRAVDRFNRVVERRGARADTALYWKAYAQSKLGQRAEALSTLAALRQSHPKSRSLEQARALELEIRNSSGQTVSPESVQNEELKLFALQGLSNQDPDKAVPMLEKIIRGDSSSKLKERAMFVLAQMSEPRARRILADAAKDEAHPDIQSKAIQYLGIHGGQENRALLSEVYQTSSNVRVKKRVLQAWMIAGEKDRILAAATGEKDPELRGEAIQQLGVMGAQDELMRLYKQESTREVKKKILQSMFVGGASDRLLELAKTEQDPELRRTAVRNLGLTGSDRSGQALVEIYNSEKDPGIRKAVIEGLFLQNNAEAMVALARKENDPAMKRAIVERLSLMGGSKVAMDYLMELLK